MVMHSRNDGEATGRLLLIDRDDHSARIMTETLRQCLGHATRISVVSGGRQAADLLREHPYDIVLADLSSLADFSERSDDAVTRLARLAEGALVVALADGASVTAAVGAMRAGAHDYVSKPINGPAMVARIGELAQRHGKGRALSIEARAAQGLSDFAGFIGASSAMQFVYEQIARIATSAAPVFITGKVARARMCVRRRFTGKVLGPTSGWWRSIARLSPAI